MRVCRRQHGTGTVLERLRARDDRVRELPGEPVEAGEVHLFRAVVEGEEGLWVCGEGGGGGGGGEVKGVIGRE